MASSFETSEFTEEKKEKWGCDTLKIMENKDNLGMVQVMNLALAFTKDEDLNEKDNRIPSRNDRIQLWK